MYQAAPDIDRYCPEAVACLPCFEGLAGSPHETLPEEGRLVIPWPIARLALTLGGNRFRARQRRHGDEDDAGPVLKMCAAEERWCAAPRELDVSALAGHSKDLGLETVSIRQYDHVPLFRFLMLVTAGSDEGR